MNLYNKFLEKLVLPTAGIFFGKTYQKNIILWGKYDSLSEDELEDIQNKNLRNILVYTSKNLLYYRNFNYDESLSPIDNLKKFPVLTKEILRSERENLVSNSYDPEKLQKNYSSGSSGVQSYSYSVKDNKYLMQAIQGHWYKWSGYKIGDKILQFGMSPNRIFPKNVKDLFYRVNYQNAFSLTDKDFEILYKKITSKKTEYIIGYPSAINEFSKFLIKNGLNHPIKGVISLGDKLFPHFERNFSLSFSSPKIIDTYGCAEGLLMACRNDLPYYYIMSPHVYIEIVDADHNPVKDGELGYVLVTCFTNLAQPFIRYKLGDLAIKLPKEKYPPDRKFKYPLLEKIVGRETDIVKTSNGRTLIVHSFTGILEYFPQIKQYRIIQENINEIKIEYITDLNFSVNDNDLSEIKKKIDIITEKGLGIEFQKVDFIPSTPSGKPQIIKSIFAA